MSTKFFTNTEGNSLINKFEGVFTFMQNIYFFDALVGYFQATGYFKIRPFLEKVPKIRVLVGINVDELTAKYNSKGQLYLNDPRQTADEFIKQIKEDIQEANYSKEIEEGIYQFVSDIVEQKVEVRAHPEKILHAKIYIFRPKTFNVHTPASVITGSSNLTKAGLGASEKSNYEFNVQLNDYDDVKFATDEFEKLWKESTNILPVDISKIVKETYLNKDFTPYELYIKLLIEYFGKRIEYNPASIDLLLPDTYKRLTYQSEAAIEGYEKMMQYNGFFLADVVGLGKTIVACIIAKKFIYENGFHTKILVVYPPALEDNWMRTVHEFGIKNNFELVTTGSLHKILDREDLRYSNPDEFDLIIIDEAHKFRSDVSQMYEKLQMITKSDRKIPGENGDRKKKLMLLSATPLNNRPADIENQIYLFQDKRNSNLPKIRDLQSFFKPLKEKYKQLRRDSHLDIRKLKNIYDKIRDKVIEPLVIRRTRTDILNNPEYLKDIEEQGIIFPTINPPNAVMYEFDDRLSQLFDHTVTYLTGFDEYGNEADGLEYYRYRAIEFLMPEHQEQYGDVVSISGRLSAIMKTLLIKRLESSFYAFKTSLSRFQNNTQNMIDMFSKNKVYIAPDIDVNKYLDEGKETELEQKINEMGGNNQWFENDDFQNDFLNNLKKDKKKIDDLVAAWDEIDYDPKWDKFIRDFKKVFLKKKINPSGKLIIFSESKDTTDYLAGKLKESGYDRLLAIHSDNRKDKEKTIRANFDANLGKSQWEYKFDFIISTEVLAEGINLHRSNVILNYDVPWNSTRLMQRIGRVNRIGTEATEISIFNFYPTDDANNQIRLTDTAIRKLQAFHTAFGEDSQIYSQLEEVGEAGLYGSTLKEEINETLKYLLELRRFKKENLQWFDSIKRIPYRARLGRDCETVKSDFLKAVPDSTTTYLKSRNHPGVFYNINPDNIVSELSFLEAASIFKANVDEKAIDLNDSHHTQVCSAIEHFSTKLRTEKVHRVSKKDLSPAEKRVLPKLEFLIDQTQNDYFKNQLRRAKDEIYKGSHRQLPNELDKFFKGIKKDRINDPQKIIELIFKRILDKFRFSVETEIEDDVKPEYIYIKPTIVISESFK
jgi:superfamily II DNA/RNA helicase